MDQILLAIKLIISGLLGLLIGSERELLIQKENIEVATGLRTFALITLLGTLSAYISTYMVWFLPLMLSGVILLNLASYFVTSKKDIGLTTEITVLIAFLIGSLVYYGDEKLSIAFTILLVLLLSTRKVAHDFVKKIEYFELLDTLKFAIIAFVILPFLPNQGFGYFNLLNPYKIWLMVVFSSGVSYVGYILTKIFGPEKGINMVGIFGGIASSTAVTSVMSSKSKETESINPLVFATGAASSIMFIRVLFLIAVINPVLCGKLAIPLLTMSFVGILSSLTILKNNSKTKTDLKLNSPFKLTPALKFGLFFTLTLIVSRLASLYLGVTGLYFASFLSGLVDIDAIVLSISTMVGSGVTYESAVISIFLASLANTAFKFSITYLSGKREFSKKVGIIFLLIILFGLISIILF